MASLETFDSEVKELVSSGKLSASKVKSVTDAAMANISHDAHLVATLFKLHKQAKASHKLSSLYIIDAIAREAKQLIKKGKDKGKSTNSPSVLSPGEDDGFSSGRLRSKGTCTSFLSKIESFLDRLVAEVLSKGPPEHKEKVKKVLDIWNKTSTFSPEALKSAYAKLNGEADATGQDKKDRSVAASRPTTTVPTSRSTTPPYPPPEIPIRFPTLPPPPIAFTAPTAAAPTFSATLPQLPNANVLALAGDQLASLLALTSGSAAPQASFLPLAPAPAFESSQLALLQQLASQTSGGSLPGTSSSSESQNISNPTSLPFSSDSLPSRPAQSSFTQSSQDFSSSSRGPPPNAWQRDDDDFDSRRRRRDQDRRDSPPPRDSAPDSWGGDRSRGSRRRSASPPPRETDSGWGRRQREVEPSMDTRAKTISAANSISAWKERNLGGGGGGGSMAEAAPARTETSYRRPSDAWSKPEHEQGRIATFISSEFDEENSMRKGKRAAQTRNEFDAVDLSSFEVSVTESSAGHDNNIPSFQPREDQSQQMQPSHHHQQEEDTPAALLLRNAKPFDPMNFDALSPECWASFANMCLSLYGYMPSNTEMVSWIMMKMSMMGAGPGGMGASGSQDNTGNMQAGMDGNGGHSNSRDGLQSSPPAGGHRTDGHSRSRSRTSEQEGVEGYSGEMTGNTEEEPPQELGEADMDVTSDEEK